MNAVQNPERFGSQWATNIATGFIPNIIRQPIRASDDYVRDTTLPKDLGFWQAMERRVGQSVLPQSAPVKVDVFGKPVEKDTAGGGPGTDLLLRLFSPIDTKGALHPDPLDVALYRYNLKHPDEGQFSVTAPSREITRTINGKEVKVTLPQNIYDEMTRKAGTAARSAIGSRYNDRNLDDKDVKHIKDIITKFQSLQSEIAFRRAYKP